MSEIASAVDEALIHLCPDCGGHLGDTWDDDADECGRCGFRYVQEYGSTPEPRSTTSLKATGATVVGFVLALHSGATLAQSSMVTPAVDSSGAVIVSPDTAFFVSIAWGVVSLLALTAAQWWSR